MLAKALPYLRYGIWHYYYRRYYGAFFIGLVLIALISFGFYVYQEKILFVYILVLWFEEKSILLYLLYLVFRSSLQEYATGQSVVEVSFFQDHINAFLSEKVHSLIEQTFTQIDTFLREAFYANIGLFILAIILSRVLLNAIARHKLNIFLQKDL